jgi:hypothetical protein
MVIYYQARELTPQDMTDRLNNMTSEIALKDKEITWANQYISKLETRIIDLHKLIDKLMEESRMAKIDINIRHLDTDCHECRYDDCQTCPCVPELAVKEIQRPYTL